MNALRALAPRQIIRSTSQRIENYSVFTTQVNINGSKKNYLTPYNFNNVRYLNIRIAKEEKKKDSLSTRIYNKIIGRDITLGRLSYRAHLIYENTVDNLNYEEWIKDFQLVDAYISWFVITELHVWMLMVRAMGEINDGEHFRNAFSIALWSDAETRVKKLRRGAINPLVIKQITLLTEQYRAALVGYDEGLLVSDMVLAGALWRRFFNYSCNDPRHIERLIKYIRMHIEILENMPRNKLINDLAFKWIPISKIKV